MSSIKLTYKKILDDYAGNNPTLFKCIVAIFLNPSFNILFNFRIGQYLFNSKYKFFRVLSSRKRMKLVLKKSCDISFNAVIGKKLRLAHPTSVVIGSGSILKNNIVIYQNVTLGSNGKHEKTYPVIENGVIIYASSTIIGGVTIGENSIIGANTLVNIDVPPNSFAVGIPCRIIKRDK